MTILYLIFSYFIFKLKQAQNGLFCRELFDQLCREAATYRPIVPIYVIGDTITTQIFPDTKFIIQLQRRPFKVGERNMESFDKEKLQIFPRIHENTS